MQHILRTWERGLPYSLLKLLSDLVLWTLAAPLAFWLRFDGTVLDHTEVMLSYTLVGVLLKLLMIRHLRLHRQSWHRIGVRDLFRLLRGNLAVMLPLLILSFLLHAVMPVPRSIPPLEALLAVVTMGGTRLLLRLVYEEAGSRVAAGVQKEQRALIVGAGDTGTMLARELLRHPEDRLLPIGFIDDDPDKRNESFLGLKVFGCIEDLPTVASVQQPDEILIAIPSAPGKVIRRVVELAREAKIKHRIVPGLYDILSGKVKVSQLRDVSVEDLLRREPIELDCWGISEYIKDQVVLVTGAGGSIGSEIVRQVATFLPEAIVLLGRGENNLFELERELDRTFPRLTYHTVVADVKNCERLDRIFAQHRPRVVFHAAAHKHVPMMEANPDEAILNNVGGTRNIAEMALKYGVERLVNISTDKAVRPSSIMGASKRAAERVIASAAQHAALGQRFVSVRFGNVLGSRGSVVPVFKEQIRRGGPVTVTHPEATRYFMTIPEAVELVLEAARLAENGAIYMLDMGEPIRIADLAKDLIRLSGLEPDDDIEISYTGLRPGEKLVEELLSAEEGARTTKHEKILVVQDPTLSQNGRGLVLEQLLTAARNGDIAQIEHCLHEMLPSYDSLRARPGR